MKRAALRIALTATMLLPATVNAAPADAARDKVIIRGAWFDAVPCLPLTGAPGPGVPPGTFTLTCVGMTEYTGDWVGHVVFTASGTVNTETRQAYATAEQWFYGIYAKDGTYGSIHFRSVVYIDLATGAFHDTSWIIDGTCGFAGSTGRIEFEGAQPAGLIGSGGYVGSWSRTTPSSPSIPCDPGVPAIELPS